jgi:hypothetical protein
MPLRYACRTMPSSVGAGRWQRDDHANRRAKTIRAIEAFERVGTAKPVKFFQLERRRGCRRGGLIGGRGGPARAERAGAWRRHDPDKLAVALPHCQLADRPCQYQLRAEPGPTFAG